VVTNPEDNFIAAGSGEAYLFSGRTGALLGDLVGSSPQDRVGDAGGQVSGPGPRNNDPGSPPQGQVGIGGVTVLANGNYVVQSPHWNGDRGAATWADGTAGVSGPVDASNSLVGSNPGDLVGNFGATALPNGNYVVLSPVWNGRRGAATWGDGTRGVTGAVDPSNSLVGTGGNDNVGSSVTVLANGNYVVSSFYSGRGAVTWGDGTAGVSGPVSAANSLVGFNPDDQIGNRGVLALSNGNYVVKSAGWSGNRGAATWGDGRAGITGTVDASNSLVGSHPGAGNTGDQVGSSVTALPNGNYVVDSPVWNGGIFTSLGAVTWGDGRAGVTGPVDASNSLVGSHPGDIYTGDHVGYGMTELANGNYVVQSPRWNGNRGAATWGSGTAGVSGTADASNSLVGSNPGDTYTGDQVGYSVTGLANGNYVVATPWWNGSRGAATWGDGTTGVTGLVDTSNSLVGSHPSDRVGASTGIHSGVTALANGNYVVQSPYWNSDRGAATWGDGTVGITGPVDASNSLVG
jgi:hypothetical protein